MKQEPNSRDFGISRLQAGEQVKPGYRSPLGRMLPTAMNVEEVKRRGYREDGIVVIDLNNDRLDAIEREIVKQWAERRYPKQSRMGEGN